MIVADHVVRDTIKRIVSRKKYNGPLVKTTS